MLNFKKCLIFTRMKTLFLSLFTLATSVLAWGQKIEYGIGTYAAMYRGDLMQDYGSASSFSAYSNYLVSNLGYGGSLHLKNNIDNQKAIRFGLTYGHLSGADSRAMSGKNGDPRRNRNLSFFTDILEFSAMYDYNFRPFGIDKYEYRFTPYVVGGVALFHFNPKTEYKGNVYELQPLNTEGQNLIKYPNKNSYALTTLAIPLGAGLRFALTDHLRLDLEFNYRFTTTDYLDDVSGTYADNSTIKSNYGEISAALADRRVEKGIKPFDEGVARGSAKYKDGYIMMGLHFRYTIINNACAAFR